MTRKSDLEAVLLSKNNESLKLDLNVSPLEELMVKELEHGWALIFKIDSICHIKDAGVVPLGSAQKIPINYKGEH